MFTLELFYSIFGSFILWVITETCWRSHRDKTWTHSSGTSRPSAKEGARLTINVEFCEDNSGTLKKMRYFRKNKVAGAPPLVPPLHSVIRYFLKIYSSWVFCLLACEC